MTLRFFPKCACLWAGIATFCISTPLMAQTGPPSATLTAEAELPDAPQPQQPQTPPVTPAQNPLQDPSSTPASRQQPASNQGSNSGARPSAGASSNSQDASRAVQSSEQEKSEREKAAEQIKEQETQRVAGLVPTFNISYRPDAAALSPGQKMNLSFHSALDPFTIVSALAEAGYHEAANDLTGFSWGPKGFAERAGVAYLDSFNGTILSTGVFPIIFHQDPRYFRLGHGTVGHRVLYAMATSVVAKHDYTGKWGPNYGNLLGTFAAGALSNLYYPGGNSSIGLTISTSAIQIAEGVGGTVFNEFWPDISRRFLHKDPTHGQDALYNQAVTSKAP